MRNLLAALKQVLSSLRLRLLLLVVVTCLPLVVLVVHSAGEDRRRALVGFRQRGQKLLEIAMQDEEELVGGTRQLLLALAKSADLRMGNPRRCEKLLHDLYASYTRYSNLGLLTTNGQVVASAAPVPDADALADCPLVRRLMETRSFAVGNLPHAKAAERATVAFGYPVLDETGNVRSMVFAEVDLRPFYRFSSGLPAQVPRGMTWSQIDRQGIILARYPNPEEWIGQPLPERTVAEAAFNSNEEPLVARDHRGMLMVYDLTLTRSQLLGGSPVAAVLGIPQQSLFAGADQTLRRHLTWLGFAAGVALVFGWVGSKWLVLHPVKALVKSSAQLAAGNLATRAGPPYSRDELGQLKLAFDRMAESLEQRELDRRLASEKLHLLSHRLVEVQESERRHIARELHDEIGQSLTAADLHLQAALQAPGSAALRKRLEESIQAVEHVLEQVHDLSLNLRPSMLDDLGLEPALRWYAQRQAALANLHARFKTEPLEQRLDPLIETECFRIAQEALNNVVRHARATAVNIELTRKDGWLHLTVRDNGVGFDAPSLRDQAMRGASLGLLSMEERAALTGGGLEMDSTPRQGTKIHAWFPLRWRSQTTQIEIHE